MSEIVYTDSELYELLLEVCDNAYMPNPVSLFTCDGSLQMTVEAISVKITDTLSIEAYVSKESIKTYISEFINTSLKKYGRSFCFYPYKILKSNKGMSLILRGAFQKQGWITDFKESDKLRIKAELDEVELTIINNS